MNALNPVEILENRQVTEVETARALMEPMRLAILRALTQRGLRKLTAKEIAEELDEGQTKLYRHLKQLEEHGLVHVAETRVVSGIIEKRYAASQKRLTIDGGMLGLAEIDPDDAAGPLTAPLEAAREYLLTELRAGRIVLQPAQDGPDLRYRGIYNSFRLRPEDYAELWRKVTAVISEYSERESEDNAPGTVPVLFQALMFAVDESVGRKNASDASEAGTADATEIPTSPAES